MARLYQVADDHRTMPTTLHPLPLAPHFDYGFDGALRCIEDRLANAANFYGIK